MVFTLCFTHCGRSQPWLNNLCIQLLSQYNQKRYLPSLSDIYVQIQTPYLSTNRYIRGISNMYSRDISEDLLPIHTYIFVIKMLVVLILHHSLSSRLRLTKFDTSSFNFSGERSLKKFDSFLAPRVFNPQQSCKFPSANQTSLIPQNIN